MSLQTFAETIAAEVSSNVNTKLLLVSGGLLGFVLDFNRGIVTGVVDVLLRTPDVYPNPAVEDVFQLTFLVAIILAGLGLALLGGGSLFSQPFGLEDAHFRVVLPKLILGLSFSLAALPLLQLVVDLSNALVEAFTADVDTATLAELTGLGVGAGIAAILSWPSLVGFAIVLLIRKVYILAIAASAPLIAVAWAFPKTERYARGFIAAWFAAIAIAPVDSIILIIALALFRGSELTGLELVGSWVFGIASFTLLILVPLQLYNMSQAIVGSGLGYGRSIGGTTRGLWRRGSSGSDGAGRSDGRQSWNSDGDGRSGRYRRGPRR